MDKDDWLGHSQTFSGEFNQSRGKTPWKTETKRD